MKNVAIIVAAGAGTRLGGPVPKPYIEIHGKPVISWTVEAYGRADCVDEIIVVVGEDRVEFCRNELFAGEAGKVRVIAGGRERTDSVYAGLLACPDADLVFIHDGARPCVSRDVIARGCAAAQERGTAVAAIPVRDTIKRAAADGTVLDTPDRAELYAIQTPQIFWRKEILAAYEAMRAAAAAAVTDDAQVMERYGTRQVFLYPGDEKNIKITTPQDLEIVRHIL